LWSEETLCFVYVQGARAAEINSNYASALDAEIPSLAIYVDCGSARYEPDREPVHWCWVVP